jgi:hypothetical protein
MGNRHNVQHEMEFQIFKTFKSTYRSNIAGTTQSMSIRELLYDAGTCNRDVKLMLEEQQERLKVRKQRNRHRL